jgi:Zn-finger nucleic acid-binding protein
MDDLDEIDVDIDTCPECRGIRFRFATSDEDVGFCLGVAQADHLAETIKKEIHHRKKGMQ